MSKTLVFTSETERHRKVVIVNDVGGVVSTLRGADGRGPDVPRLHRGKGQ